MRDPSRNAALPDDLRPSHAGRRAAKVTASTQGVKGFESPRLHQPYNHAGFSHSTAQGGHQKAGGHLITAVDAFLLSRRVANCSSRTLEVYAANLARFARARPGCSPRRAPQRSWCSATPRTS